MREIKMKYKKRRKKKITENKIQLTQITQAMLGQIGYFLGYSQARIEQAMLGQIC